MKKKNIFGQFQELIEYFYLANVEKAALQILQMNGFLKPS